MDRTATVDRHKAGIEHFHPLEIFPYFRRWPAGLLRDLVYTLVWSVGIGVLFWAIGAMFRPRGLSLGNLVSNVTVAVAIGYTLHALLSLTGRLGIDAWARSLGPVFTAAYYTVVSTIGVFVGFLLVALALDTSALSWILQPRWIAAMGISSAVISIMIAAIFFSRERQARAEAALERESLRIERAERQATLANLRALQAQVEPHFLFNTLANVTSLVDADPVQAKRMLDCFNRFLRASLASTRSESTTLAAERDLIAAFLEVLQVRMGARLRFRIDLEPAAAAFQLPPMLLQPLVENAIRHGLEPQVEGGEVAVSMRREDASIAIAVEDSGVGFAPTTTGGLGLTNVRDRLRLLYGGHASLLIGERDGGGTRVVVRIPA
ncbi:MAG TPA: histidine kinase [Usitatibacter sp.]|nr:histidine kinase [Usitatibacter sp.]